MMLEVGAREMFDVMPHWDRDAEHANQVVFEGWTLASGSAPLEVSDEVPSSVIWDEEPLHHLDLQGGLLQQLPWCEQYSDGLGVGDAGQTLVEMYHKEVSWDDASIHNIASHDSLLQQLNQGGCEWEPTAELFINELPTHVNDTSLLLEVRKSSVHEMFTEMSPEMVLWDEESHMCSAPKVFTERPLIDDVVALVKQTMFVAPVESKAVAHEVVSKMPLADVIWDTKSAHEQLHRMPLADVIWYEESRQHEESCDLLQRLAHGDCLVSEKMSTAESEIDEKVALDNESSPVSEIVMNLGMTNDYAVPLLYEIFNERVWNEHILSDLEIQDNLLQDQAMQESIF